MSNHRFACPPRTARLTQSRKANRSVAVAGVVAAGVIGTPGLGFAQSYTVSVEESGPLPTSYEKRFNWRILPGYRHTTMVASPTDPLACSESPCLDDGGPGDQPPDLTRGGTATAIVGAMQPGVYQLELRYNQTANRSTSVPWTVTTDAPTGNSRSGTLNQRDTAPAAGNWLVLGNTSSSPIAVASTLTFVLGSTTTTFNGSLSYGGIRLVKVAEGAGGSGGGGGGTPVDDPACAPLASREYDDAPVLLDEPAGSAVRLTFTLDDVPAPTGITFAQLTMRLFDADHPGEEGMVYVNGHEPLALPADASWGNASADAVLALPPDYLVQGTNVVELGVGSRPTTYYSASLVALELFGPACATGSDGGAGGSGTGGSGATSAGGTSGQGAGAGGAAGGLGPVSAAPASGDSAGGCGCTTSSRSATFSTIAWLVLAGGCIVRGRRRRARRRAS